MEIKTIGVVGAGQMGAGITQVAARAGYNVIMSDCHYSGNSLKGVRDERAAQQSIVNSVYDIPALFAGCRDVASNSAECLRTDARAESA